jgi:hypothetical protein
MTFILKHTHPQEVPHYFLSQGATHFSETFQKTIHLIDSTSPDIRKARRFDTIEDANLILARAGTPPGWATEKDE